MLIIVSCRWYEQVLGQVQAPGNIVLAFFGSKVSYRFTMSRLIDDLTIPEYYIIDTQNNR